MSHRENKIYNILGVYINIEIERGAGNSWAHLHYKGWYKCIEPADSNKPIIDAIEEVTGKTVKHLPKKPLLHI